MSKSRKITIKTETGVHARPAAVFVEIAHRFPCEVHVIKENKKVNGKSIMGLMMLAMTRGTEITIETDGEQEEEALDTLSDLINSNFTLK